MSAITRQALADGALGFSTSRFYGHMDKAGNLVPGTHATADEMVAIAEAFSDFDHGTMEIISDYLDQPEELAWIEHIARLTKRPLTFLVTPNINNGIWELADKLNPEGLAIRPQVGARPGVGADDCSRARSTRCASSPPTRRSRTCPSTSSAGCCSTPTFRAKVLADERQGVALRRHEQDDLHVAQDVRAAHRSQLRARLSRFHRRDRRGAGHPRP